MPGWRPRRRRECLLALEEMDAAGTATRARVLAVFAAARGYAADGDYSPRSWLIHRTRITICQWSDKLPPDCRDAADAILVAAAAAGAELPDLVQPAAEMYARSLPDPGEDGDRPDEVFEDRKVTVETTFAGAGVMSGDLTPECAAVVTAVLESLSAPMGAEDTRTREQRYHDGLQEAITCLARFDRWLIASFQDPRDVGVLWPQAHHCGHANLLRERSGGCGRAIAVEAPPVRPMQPSRASSSQEVPTNLIKVRLDGAIGGSGAALLRYPRSGP